MTERKKGKIFLENIYEIKNYGFLKSIQQETLNCDKNFWEYKKGR